MQQFTLDQLTSQYLARNYDYLWLKTMLKKCGSVPPGSTLITGSSHALNGIWEGAWTSAVNCSMHSQDLYYDYLCARRAITSTKEHRFNKCFIVMGYYIAFQDLSSSKNSRESVVSNIYYPIFHDGHNWEDPIEHDPWAWVNGVPAEVKTVCEQAAAQTILTAGTYYSHLRSRGTFFNLQGRTWAQVSEHERQIMGRTRAESHNKLFQHKESFEENKMILQAFVSFLYEHDVLPIVVVTPFTSEYNQSVLQEIKESVCELVDSVQEDVHYVDFNENAEGIFSPSDFMDTDHLSADGAKKVSNILAELFGA